MCLVHLPSAIEGRNPSIDSVKELSWVDVLLLLLRLAGTADSPLPY